MVKAAEQGRVTSGEAAGLERALVPIACGPFVPRSGRADSRAAIVPPFRALIAVDPAFARAAAPGARFRALVHWCAIRARRGTRARAGRSGVVAGPPRSQCVLVAPAP